MPIFSNYQESRISKVIRKQQERRLAQLEFQLSYTGNIIEQRSNEMEAWELKDYLEIRDSYQKDILALHKALDSTIQTH